jgi:SAM-dependent methyltransferase
MGVDYFTQIWASKESENRSYMKGDGATWDQRVGDFNRDEPDERIENITALLLDKKMLNPDSTVLDIGCGPGRFAIEFAQTAKQVTGIDISPKMLQSAADNASAQKINNTDFMDLDWEKADLAALQWRKKFSLVTAIMSPALDSKESLDKMMEASSDYCLISHFVKRHDSISGELKNILGRPTVDEFGNKNLYCSFNILWHYKLFPEIIYFETEKVKIRTLEEANRHYLKRLEIAKELSPAQKEQVINFLKSKAVNGLVSEDISAKIACLYWKNN